MNTRSSIQRVHFQAESSRDVSNPAVRRFWRRRLAARKPFRELNRFTRRIAGEGICVFDNVRRARKIIQAQIVEFISQDRANLLPLVAVPRRQQKSRHSAHFPYEKPTALSVCHEFHHLDWRSYERWRRRRRRWPHPQKWRTCPESKKQHQKSFRKCPRAP